MPKCGLISLHSISMICCSKPRKLWRDTVNFYETFSSSITHLPNHYNLCNNEMHALGIWKLSWTLQFVTKYIRRQLLKKKKILYSFPQFLIRNVGTYIQQRREFVPIRSEDILTFWLTVELLSDISTSSDDYS